MATNVLLEAAIVGLLAPAVGAAVTGVAIVYHSFIEPRYTSVKPPVLPATVEDDGGIAGAVRLEVVPRQPAARAAPEPRRAEMAAWRSPQLVRLAQRREPTADWRR